MCLSLSLSDNTVVHFTHFSEHTYCSVGTSICLFTDALSLDEKWHDCHSLQCFMCQILWEWFKFLFHLSALSLSLSPAIWSSRYLHSLVNGHTHQPLYCFLLHLSFIYSFLYTYIKTIDHLLFHSLIFQCQSLSLSTVCHLMCTLCFYFFPFQFCAQVRLFISTRADELSLSLCATWNYRAMLPLNASLTVCVQWV